jgi:hypothetical protein
VAFVLFRFLCFVKFGKGVSRSSGSSASLSLEKAFQGVLFLDKFGYGKAFVFSCLFF